MSTISKVFTVVNIVLALFLLGSVSAILAEASDYKNLYEQEQSDRQKDVAKLTAEKEDLEQQANRLRNEASTQRNLAAGLEDDKQSLTAERDQLRADNNQLRAAVDGINTSVSSLQNQLADSQSQIQTLTQKNADYRQERDEAEARRMAAEENVARLEGERDRLGEDRGERERQLVALTGERDNLRAEQMALTKAGVDIPAIIGNVVPLIEGSVSAVGPGFVVLSVGEQDGVQIGFPFDVYRAGGDYIGRVVVTDILPDNCTARVQVKNKKGLEFRATDKATTRL